MINRGPPMQNNKSVKALHTRAVWRIQGLGLWDKALQKVHVCCICTYSVHTYILDSQYPVSQKLTLQKWNG